MNEDDFRFSISGRGLAMAPRGEEALRARQAPQSHPFSRLSIQRPNLIPASFDLNYKRNVYHLSLKGRS